MAEHGAADQLCDTVAADRLRSAMQGEQAIEFTGGAKAAKLKSTIGAMGPGIPNVALSFNSRTITATDWR
jgi:hypothetical protein